MASVVLKNIAGAAGGSGSSDAPQMVVEAAQAVSTIMDIFREQARKIAEENRQDDNDFNIRKNFLENAVAAINDLLQGQFNIMVLTDQEHDIEWGGPLKGRLLPMDLVEVEISNGRKVNFQVMVFDEGKYLRKGKWEEDSISWYPDSAKMWKDVNMHIEFSAQPKKPTDGVPTRDELTKKEADKKTADDAAAKQTADAEAAKKAEEEKNAPEGDDDEDEKSGDEEADASYGKGPKGTVTNASSHIGKNGALNEDNEKTKAEGGKPDVKGKKTATDKKKPKKEESYDDEDEDEEDSEEGEDEDDEDEEEEGEDEDDDEDEEEEGEEDEPEVDEDEEDGESEEEDEDAGAEDPDEDADEDAEEGEEDEEGKQRPGDSQQFRN